MSGESFDIFRRSAGVNVPKPACLTVVEAKSVLDNSFDTEEQNSMISTFDFDVPLFFRVQRLDFFTHDLSSRKSP
jgi:hypothetical protein